MNYKVVQLIPYVGEEELINLTKVIKNKWLTEGPFSKELIDLIKKITKAKYALLTNNGTLALYLSLKAVGIKENDEVIVPDFTFNATASSVVFAGGKPVFADVSKKTGNIDVDMIEKKITNKTRAIMPVHVYGTSADLDPILELSARYNLKIIEDAAQAFGVYYCKENEHDDSPLDINCKKNKHAGTLGDVGIISFFADKTITSGEGAVILTNDEKIYNQLTFIRNQGRLNSGNFVHPELGMNFRFTDLQAAVAVAQVKKFEKIKKIKLSNYALYNKLLKNIDEINYLEVPSYSNIVPFRFNIVVQKKDELIEYLEKHRIQTRGFFYPLHKQPCFSYLNNRENDFPASKYLFQNGISLPVHCDLSKEDIQYVCDAIKSFYKKN